MATDDRTQRFLKPLVDALVEGRAATARHGSMRLPNRRDEEWRFVRLRRLTDMALTPPDAAASWNPSSLERLRFEEPSARIVLVDGRYVEAWSEHSDDVQVRFGEPVDPAAFHDDVFATLNAAMAPGAVRITVAEGTASGSVHVVHVSSASEAAHIASPQIHIEVSDAAKITVIEQYASLGAGPGFTNTVSAVTVGSNARCNHVIIQGESTGCVHINRRSVSVVEGSHYLSMAAHFGAGLSRQDVRASIGGPHATCELHGLAVLDGDQVSDTHTVMDHERAHALSDQLHKCVAGEKSHSVFNGKIFVRQDAQQINAFQLNRNLLLSNKAKVDTKPQLEIFADDVKCSHGATIGQLDSDQLFYLATRGISPEQARGLLTYAFAAEVVEKVPVPSVRKLLERWIAEKVGY
ncbi:MAG: Fe-S cluster assembly protein SufD [Myxococcota bacterium]